MLTRFPKARGLALVSALSFCAPGVSAQQSFETEHRDECRQAARAMTDPAGNRAADARRIFFCESSGPPALAAAWARVAVVPDSLGTLLRLSVQVRDRRLYHAVSEIALDASEPELKRAAALSLLGRWAQPGSYLDYEQFFAPGFRSVGQNGLRITGLSCDPQYAGGEPLLEDMRTVIAEVAQQVADSEASFRLRAMAEVLAGVLRL